MDLGVHRLHDDSEPQVLKELVIRCAAGGRAGGRACALWESACVLWCLAGVRALSVFAIHGGVGVA